MDHLNIFSSIGKGKLLQKAIVTGGAGFIGSHLVDALIEDDVKVLVFDNLTTGKLENLNQDAIFTRGDVVDRSLFESTCGKFKPDTIFHLAAQADPKRAYRDPAFDSMINIRGTINVALTAAQIGIDKFIFTSTGGAMYGSPDPGELPVSEDRAPSPASPYGLSKYCAELYIAMLHRDHGLNYTILRPANIFGPRQDPASEVGVVLIFLEQMLANISPILRGYGKATRDYVYVKDLVSALMGAANFGGARPYHIGTGKEINVETIFNALQERLGSSFKPERAPLIAGEVQRMSLKASRAYQDFGWEPAYKMGQGLDETVSWAVNKVSSNSSLRGFPAP